MRLADVAGSLSINPSTCLNILHTLAEDGFVTARDRTYALGPEMVNLAYGALEAVDEFSQVQMLIDRFSRDHHVNVRMWRIDGNDAIAVTSSSEPSAPMAINVIPQRRMPMLNGSIGRIVAAFKPMARAELQTEFARVEWRALSFERFLEQAEHARMAGYAIECGDVVEGINAVAAPVFAADGSLDRIISIFALAVDLPRSRIDKTGEALAELAARIGRR